LSHAPPPRIAKNWDADCAVAAIVEKLAVLVKNWARSRTQIHIIHGLQQQETAKSLFPKGSPWSILATGLAPPAHHHPLRGEDRWVLAWAMASFANPATLEGSNLWKPWNCSLETTLGSMV